LKGIAFQNLFRFYPLRFAVRCVLPPEKSLNYNAAGIPGGIYQKKILPPLTFFFRSAIFSFTVSTVSPSPVEHGDILREF
jgi:hypothetical protein